MVHRTPWIRRHLASDSAEVRWTRRQPIPVEGQSSKLEIAMKEYYNWELKRLETPMQVMAKNNLGSSKTITRICCGQSIKAHLKKDPGPDVGKEYGPPREEDHSQDE